MDFKTLDLNKIIDDYGQGLRKNYDILFSTLKINNTSEDKINEETLIIILKQFHLVVVRLGPLHFQLTNELLKIDWTKKSEVLSQEYQSFVLDLLTAHTAIYLHECLNFIVKQFMPKGFSVNIKFFADMSPEEQEAFESENRRKHELLRKITKIVPSSIVILENLLSQVYPLPANIGAQESYVINLLQVSSYVAHLRGLIFKLIVNNMINYDSEVSREEIRKLEDGSVCIPTAGDVNMKQKQAKVLDCLMKHFFIFIRDQSYRDGELQWEATKKLYLELKKTFGSLLLKTFKTCHVQFFMFYICSFKMDLTLDFLEFLWNEVTSLNKDYIYRQLATSYLSSLLARARYIPTWLVKRQLTRMKTWIHNYMDNSSDQYRPLFEVHGVFYVVCQSFFYIIAFRHKDIIDTTQGHKFCMDLHLQKITSCLLNPLRFCFLPIAETFCSVVRSNQIAFCDNVLERNRRMMIADTSANMFRSFVVSYFPFDPYVLTRSYEFVKPCYLDYDDEFLNMSNNRETLDEDMDYEEYNDSDPAGIEVTQNIDLQLSPKIASFFLYSTSPGFKN